MDGELKAHTYAGRLFVVEGIDGSGKSTQLDLLYKWLSNQGYSVFFSEWNSSELVKDTTRRGKRKRMLTPTTFSLIHATDFAARFENRIVPLLKAGVIVLADRYCFTAFARDAARGVSPGWVRHVYSFAVQPDIVFYFKVQLETAISRIRSSRFELKYYEAGRDLHLADEDDESFRLFQERILEQYEAMAATSRFTCITAELPIEEQQRQMREIVGGVLARAPHLRRTALAPTAGTPQ
ncbi:MAG: dTMP kinase [Armatimonadetes bacterium]|nr:dTMP kinase [Armatimonadota bacterium]MDE2206447.1 dTMP kinase [Armatimonadota bacterium]